MTPLQRPLNNELQRELNMLKCWGGGQAWRGHGGSVSHAPPLVLSSSSFVSPSNVSFLRIILKMSSSTLWTALANQPIRKGLGLKKPQHCSRTEVMITGDPVKTPKVRWLTKWYVWVRRPWARSVVHEYKMVQWEDRKESHVLQSLVQEVGSLWG